MVRLPLPAPVFLPLVILYIGLSQLTGCSGSSKSAPASTNSAINMSALAPATITLQANQQQQFTVSVTGANDSSVSWDIVDASGQSHLSGDSTVGTVSDSGLYQAPAATSPLTLTLYAGAAANTSIFRTATIAVSALPLPVSVSVTPTSASAATCPTQPCAASSQVSFTAQVSNAGSQGVTWQVDNQAGGNATVGLISTAGVYTAPASVPTPSTVTVTATSNADPTKSASALVSISQAGALSISLNLANVNVTAGGSLFFTATVSPGSTPDPAVTWIATCGTPGNCGQINPTGVDSATYIAPTSVTSTLQVTVTATLDADPTKTASADVSVASPAAPSMTIVQTNPAGALQASGQASLTAQFTGLPQGSPSPTVVWPVAGTTPLFCVSTDEESPQFYDNCGGRTDDGDDGGNPPAIEPDGPGSFSPASGSVTTYTVPAIVYGLNSADFAGNSCTQATPQSPAWVYVPVTATAMINGTPMTLTAHLCIQLSPNH